jgi:hypothetical protein
VTVNDIAVVVLPTDGCAANENGTDGAAPVVAVAVVTNNNEADDRDILEHITLVVPVRAATLQYVALKDLFSNRVKLNVL